MKSKRILHHNVSLANKNSIELEAVSFDFDPEVTARVLKKGYKILEVPISYRGRGYHEGKKISWKDGLAALRCLLKFKIKES